MYKKIKLKGIEYAQYDNGCLIPIDLVRETIVINKPITLLPYLVDLALTNQEHFVSITLDRRNQVINRHIVTIGLANQSQIHARETFKPPFLDHAVSIIVAHNHPSGFLQPSDADLAATKKLSAAGKNLRYPLN
jgi:DNA repair protein RadC